MIVQCIKVKRKIRNAKRYKVISLPSVVGKMYGATSGQSACSN